MKKSFRLQNQFQPISCDMRISKWTQNPSLTAFSVSCSIYLPLKEQLLRDASKKWPKLASHPRQLTNLRVPRQILVARVICIMRTKCKPWRQVFPTISVSGNTINLAQEKPFKPTSLTIQSILKSKIFRHLTKLKLCLFVASFEGKRKSMVVNTISTKIITNLKSRAQRETLTSSQ